MPINKEALIRYRAINQTLIAKKIASKRALIAACSEAVGVDVAWRTIAGDINTMRNDDLLGYRAPIENLRNQGYRYSDSSYSIDQIPLQKDEVSALSFAAKLLKQYSHVRIFSTFSGAVEKLSQNLDFRLKNQDETNLGEHIAFEQSTSDGGSMYLNEFLEHIRQQTVVSIQYYSFSSRRQRRHVLHPYFIKEFRNRWYILGFHEEYQALRTLALERISEVSPEYGISYRPAGFNIADYYKHAIGVSITTGKPEDVELRVLPAQWQYLQSQPLHQSQMLVSESEEAVIISLRLICNYELKSLLLSMGASITVLKPLALRNELIAEARLIQQQYGKKQE